MKETKKFSLILILLTIVLTPFLVIGYIDTRYIMVSSIASYAASCIGISLGLISFRYFKMGSNQGKSILFMTSMVILWLIGDIFWDYLGEVFSYADFFYFTGYIMFFLGIIYGARTVDSSILRDTRHRLAFSAAIVVASTICFSVLIRIAPVKPDITSNLIGYIYTVFDFLLMMAVMSIVGMAIYGSYKLPWLSIGFGAFVTLIADINYYMFTTDTAPFGTPTLIFYSYSYLLFGFGFISLRAKAEDAIKMLKKDS